MDLAQEELQFLSISQILKEAVSIPRRSPHTFTLLTLTLTLVFPLSLAVLLHSLLTHSLLPSSSSHQNNNPNIPLLLFYQLLYLLFLFSFSLLSTASAVFTVASLYSSRPASFPDSLRAVPPAFRRLFPTFLVISLLILLYHLAFILSLLALLALARAHYDALFLLLLPVFLFAFLAAHVYVTALWHLASVVTVLEPVRGFAAVRKSRELLRGKTREAAGLVLMYLAACATVGVAFGEVVVRGGARYGLAAKVLVGALLVALLVVVNEVGLLVQSVFYYVCKSYHHEDIDKSALHDHLGGYLGEYVPLKSSIQMENMDI